MQYRSRGATGQTKIAELDNENLYKFDFEGLKQHCITHEKLLPESANFPGTGQSQYEQTFIKAKTATHLARTQDKEARIIVHDEECLYLANASKVSKANIDKVMFFTTPKVRTRNKREARTIT